MLPEQLKLKFVGRKRYSYIYSGTFIVLSSRKMGRNFIKKIRMSSEGGSRDIKGWGKPSIVNNNKQHSWIIIKSIPTIIQSIPFLTFFKNLLGFFLTSQRWFNWPPHSARQISWVNIGVGLLDSDIDFDFRLEAWVNINLVGSIMWWCWSRRWLRLGMSLQKPMCVFEWGVTVRLHCGYFVRTTINCRHQRRRLVWHRIRLKYEIPRDLWIGTRVYWLGCASVSRLVPGVGIEGQKSPKFANTINRSFGKHKKKNL